MNRTCKIFTKIKINNLNKYGYNNITLVNKLSCRIKNGAQKKRLVEGFVISFVAVVLSLFLGPGVISIQCITQRRNFSLLFSLARREQSKLKREYCMYYLVYLWYNTAAVHKLVYIRISSESSLFSLPIDLTSFCSCSSLPPPPSDKSILPNENDSETRDTRRYRCFKIFVNKSRLKRNYVISNWTNTRRHICTIATTIFLL